MSRRARIVALAIPLLAVVLGIVRAELFLQGAQDFVFEIEGYDPRDLLHGRYLQFRLRVEASEPSTCADSEQDCCLCLTRGADVVSQAPRMRCVDASARCDASLAVTHVQEPMRYYVPEEHARALEQHLIDAMQRNAARAVLAIDASGNVSVRELRIDGERLQP